MIEYIIDILEYYGLTADKIGPAVFVGFGGYFLYKSLKTQIGDLEEDIENLDEDVGKLTEKVVSIDNRVYYMEGRLEEN